MTKLDFKELQHKFQTSGKTLKAFLREEGIAYSTYNYWRQKLRDEAVTLPIAPISLHESQNTCATEEMPTLGIELPGVTLAFPNGVRAHFGRGSEGILMKVLTKSMGHVLPQ